MALFQNAVLQKHLKLQDSAQVDKAYSKFCKYFHDRARQKNIRESKEEQFQEGFLRELFVKIFDYTLNPEPNFNLTTELKNEKNAKKTDGAILKDGNALAVIELKSTKTKDLGLVQEQAFNYKANQTGCVYVITSNFEKLRFYINNAVDFEAFNLFTLSREQFAVMYLCLHKDNLLSNVALNIKNDSLVEEEKITKTFYQDYSLFKRELYRDLVKQNMKNEVFRAELELEDSERGTKNIKLNLFKKSQKLIDRFLFIFFAEDRGLLSPNSTLKILEQWDKLNEMDAYKPLYERFQQYFNYLDTGRAGTDKKAEIFAYNGGLFKPDNTLDALKIDDQLLYKHTKKLSNYDFDSQVDVNILGHIFENSLNEIESVNAEIEGGEFDKQKTKRKKDGVFYTPKYITKYIVDNTVGKLCTEKRKELGIVEEDYIDTRQKETKKKLLANLKAYREWLLQITICDPACGSGAFLNQALDFLIYEHQNIDLLETSLLGGMFVFPNIENTVLENNIFGVDLNEESVEIAKLSLWLRTAQPRRKLNKLNNNIQCGNSLIDDKKIAGDKAFNWQESFPNVFAKGGFDVVIGNPPYVNSKGNTFNDKEKTFYYSNFKCASYQIDLYLLFNELSQKITKKNGIISFIEPNAWLNNLYLSDIRKFLLQNFYFVEIVDTPNGVFKDATVDTLIAFWINNPIKNKEVIISNAVNNNIEEIDIFNQETTFKNENFLINIYSESNSIEIINKIEKESWKLIDICNSTSGIKEYELGKGTPPQTKEVVKNKPFNTRLKVDDNHQKHISGIDLNRYIINWKGNYLNYGEWIAAPRDKTFFNGPRFIIREIPGEKNLIVSYTDEFYTVKNTAHTFKLIDEYKDYYKVILGVLNSRCLGYYFKNKFAEFDDVFPKAKIGQCKELPIPQRIKKIIIEPWDRLIDRQIFTLNEILKISSSFNNYLISKFQLEKLTKKLQNWYELDFGEFIKELNKAIKAINKERTKEDLAPIATLSKLDEMDWMEVFESKKAEAQALQTQIDQTDKEIDQMVYELYGLTDEEIEIVENS